MQTVRKIAPKPNKAKLPLPIDTLKAVIARTKSSPLAMATTTRDACMMLMQFAAFLRVSEVVNLKPSNVKLIELNMADRSTRGAVQITVERAKNDQAGRGSVRTVPKCDEPNLCLWSAVKRYLAYQNLDDRFPGSFKPTTFFYNEQKGKNAGKPLSTDTPRNTLRKWLKEANVPSDELYNYATNSLRKAGVSRAYGKGVDILTIKRHGAWKSDAVEKYIVISKDDECALIDAITCDDADDDYDPIE
jgi:integrase